MNGLKLKQFALSLCVILSLFASSIAACGCSHHQEKAETDVSSCHQQMAKTHSEEMPMPPEINDIHFSADDNCICMKTAPRVFAKSEIIKIEKQAAAITLKVVVSIKPIASIVIVETVDFAKPFYLTDSFYNLKSPRAPPRL